MRYEIGACLHYDFKAPPLPTAAYADLYKPANIPDIKSEEGSGSPAKVGDLVQAEINGALVFKEPKRVREVRAFDSKDWVFVEGEETGIPMEQINVIEQGTGTAAPPGASVVAPRLPLPLGKKDAKFPVADGEVTIIFPETMTEAGIEDLEGYLKVFLARARREAKPN